MFLTDEAEVFRSANGEEFVQLPSGLADMLFSPNGTTYFELARGGYSGRSTDYTMSFVMPFHGVHGDLVRDGDIITCNGVGYRKVSNAEQREVTVIPMPVVRTTEYLCLDEFGVYYYIDRPERNWDYDSFRLFIGVGSQMRQVPVKSVVRYRDGGTTYVETDEGTFFSPSPFNAQQDPTLAHQWRDARLTRLDPANYKITRHFSGDATVFGGVTVEPLKS